MRQIYQEFIITYHQITNTKCFSNYNKQNRSTKLNVFNNVFLSAANVYTLFYFYSLHEIMFYGHDKDAKLKKRQTFL